MKIERIKINGLEKPLGYSYPHIQVSWNVVCAVGTKAEKTTLEFSEDEVGNHASAVSWFETGKMDEPWQAY